MPQSERTSLLIVNEHAEEIKLVTMSLRGFFTDVQVDVAYSADEAEQMTQAPTSALALVLIDEGSLSQAAPAFVTELKRRAPYAVIVLQSSRTDSGAAVQALDLGADLFLYKHSPAFLTELLFCMKEAIDKRVRKLASERADARHSWLIASLDDVVYELDADGRFLWLSRPLPGSLGYRPEELVGRHYSNVVSESERGLARFRFNERRAGSRAVKDAAITLQGKDLAHVPALISARGLYDASRRFLGTIGLIRSLAGKTTEPRGRELEQERLRGEELERILAQMTDVAQRLEQPLQTLLHGSRQLSEVFRDSRMFERIQTLTGEATTSADLLAQLTGFGRRSGKIHVINRVIEEALESAFPQTHRGGFTTDLGAALPAYVGNLDATARFVTHLLVYAQGYLTTVGRPHKLAVRTSDGDLLPADDAPTLFPLKRSTFIHLDITETDIVNPEAGHLSGPDSLDVLTLYKLAQELGATLDVSAPASAPFRMIVRLPAGDASVDSPEPMALDSPQPETGEQSQAQAQVKAQGQAQAQDARPSPAREIASATRTERRSNVRVDTTLPAKITRGSASWQGTVINISTDGAAVLMPGDFPAVTGEEAIISVVTSIATLQLQGIVTTRAPHGQLREEQVAITFREANQTETAVFDSLIAAARERALTFTLDVRIPVKPAGPEYDQPATSAAFEFAGHDRRESVRVPTALPAHLATTITAHPGGPLPVQVMNLSRSGACLLLRESAEPLGPSVQIHFTSKPRGEQGSHEPGAPDAVLGARIIWVADHASTSGGVEDKYAGVAPRLGLRFDPLTPYAERELNRVVKQHLRAQRSNDVLTATAPVVTVPRECRNARGQAIAVMDDHMSQRIEPEHAVIIVAPGYGQTASDYTALAYFLAVHQFRVLRYDATNHLGNSEGELQQTTLRSMQHDLEQVIEFVRHTWPQRPVVVLASDLAARAALKAAAQNRPPELLLLINPAIDPASMLTAVHGHDLIADYQFGLRRGVCNLLGLNVNVDQFVGDLIAGRCADLQSTLDDLRLIRSPLCIATSPADSTALPPTDLPHAFMTALGPQTQLVNMSSPLSDHAVDVKGTPPAAFRQLVKQIGSVLSIPTLQNADMAVQAYVARQHRLEEEYTFLRHDGSQINREALCAGHLAHLPHLGNLHEYRRLLDDLYGLMSPLEPGAVLVDAGIGQSDVTRAALINHIYRAGQASWTGRPSPLIIGLGRSRERVGQARHAVLVLQRELVTGFVARPSGMPPLSIGWLVGDWMNILPFKSGSLTRLVCNLSLPYVTSPVAALKEWHRVLHPDGSLILTTFHPDTDLSPLYRRHLRQASQDEFSAQAQPLLHYFARLREAIRHGILHTFDEARLTAVLRQCGITAFRILPIFDGQAFVAIVGKQNSSSSVR